MLSTGEGSYVDVDLKDFTLFREKAIQDKFDVQQSVITALNYN